MEGEELIMTQEEVLINLQEMVQQVQNNSCKIQSIMDELLNNIKQKSISLQSKINDGFRSQESDSKLNQDVKNFQQLLKNYTSNKKEFKVNIMEIILQLKLEDSITIDDDKDINSPNTRQQFQNIQQNLTQGEESLRYTEIKNPKVNLEQTNQKFNQQQKDLEPSVQEPLKQSEPDNVIRKLPFHKINPMNFHNQQISLQQVNFINKQFQQNSEADQIIDNEQNSKPDQINPQKENHDQVLPHQYQNVTSLQQDNQAIQHQIEGQLNKLQLGSTSNQSNNIKFYQMDLSNQMSNISNQMSNISNESSKQTPNGQSIKSKSVRINFGRLKSYYIPLNNILDTRDDQVCNFCGIVGEEVNLNQMGPLLILDQEKKILGHQLCVIPIVDETSNSIETQAIRDLLSVAAFQQCQVCKSFGATYQCSKMSRKFKERKCKTFYHFKCFFEQEKDELFFQPIKFHLFCGDNNHKQKSHNSKQLKFEKERDSYPQKLQKLNDTSSKKFIESDTKNNNDYNRIVCGLIDQVPQQANMIEKLPKIEFINVEFNGNEQFENKNIVEKSQDQIQNLQEGDQVDQNRNHDDPNLFDFLDRIKTSSNQKVAWNNTCQEKIIIQDSPDSSKIDPVKWNYNHTSTAQVMEFLKRKKNFQGV